MRLKIGKRNRERDNGPKITFTLEYDELGGIELVATKDEIDFYLAEISIDEEDETTVCLYVYESALEALEIEAVNFEIVEDEETR